ncbi:BglG family transcription antiterminator [Lactococcus protaetiae]|uniref:PRD domain-containing protein n=1 Tax=Lactococcus protaetiae TaxID=2592653 RepID=A0A514Z9S9_9LACT|nr:PRD domain-containing protein [Lactococcus protaetiae]QDK71340.1 PRD domain-containing protein [Lactococcus protaetiae]
MELNANERQVMSLLNFEYYVEAASLAKQLLVSDKTIRRMIKKINERYTGHYAEPLILSQAGKGFRLSAYFKDKDVYAELSVDEQDDKALYDIMLTILFSHPNKRQYDVLKIDYLSNSAKTTRLNKIKQAFKDFHLVFKTNQYYVWIEGDEIQIRRAINDLIMTINKNNSLKQIGLNLFSVDNQFIDKQVELIEEKTQQYLSYPYDWTVRLHLSVLVKRVREGSIQTSIHEINESERQLMMKNKSLADLASIITKNFSNYLNVELKEAEQLLMFQTLYAINLSRQESQAIDECLAEEVTKTLIINVFEIANVTLLPQSRRLYEDLYQHVLPMLSRLRLGIKIENNLLDEVKLKYTKTFEKLSKIIDGINHELAFETKIDEAEIGYLSLYFEKYHLEVTTDKRVLLVCATGIGTSELLKARLQKKIPNLNVIAAMSNRQARKSQGFIEENIDLILSTLDVSVTKIGKVPILTISPLLTEKDVQKINYILEESEKTNDRH